jgi:hypothetical protein
MNAEIWLGLYCWPLTSTQASPFLDLERDQRLLLRDHRVVEAAADQALDRIQGPHRVGDRLALGRLADQPLARFGKRNHGRRRARALGILDDLGVATLHHCDAGVGGAEVDTNDFGHDSTLPFPSRPAQPEEAPVRPPIMFTCRKDRVRTGAI